MFLKNLIKKNIMLFKKIKFYFKNVSIGKDTYISKRCVISNTKIGSYSYIGHSVSLANTEVGNYCSIAPNVLIGGMEHLDNSVTTSFKLKPDTKINTTFVGHDVWIGANCVIKAGVKIGDGAVVGSGSVVLKDIEPFSVNVGTPSQLLKYRFSKDDIRKIYNSRYFYFSPKISKSILSNIRF